MNSVGAYLQKNKHQLIQLLLVCVFLFAFFLRVYNTQLVNNVDEPAVIDRAVLIADGKYHIKWYNWPAQSLFRLNAVSFKIAQVYYNSKLTKFHTTSELYAKYGQVFKTLAHLLSTLFAIGSILFVYLITKRVRSKLAGTLAAFFLSISYLHSHNSRYATPDIPMTAAILANTYIALILARAKLSKRQRLLLYGASGAVAGFAVATKYTGAVAIIPIMIAGVMIFLKQKNIFRAQKKCFFQQFFLYFGSFLVALLIIHTIFNPFFFTDIQTVIKNILFEAQGQRLGHDWAGKNYYYLQNLKYYANGLLLWSGTGIALIAYLTTFYSLIRIKKKNWQDVSIISLFFFIFFFGFSLLLLHWSRWAVPFTPFVAIMAAIGLVSAYSFLQQKMKKPVVKYVCAVLFGLLIILISVPQMFISINKVRSYALGGAAADMSTYIQNNLPAGSKIAADTYTYLNPDGNYRIAAARIYLYDKTLDEYQKTNFAYVVVKPARLALAKKQPKVYKNIISFFSELDTSAQHIYSTNSGCNTILQHKRDYGFYRYIIKNGISSISNICKTGTQLSLYKLKQ